MGIVAGRKGEYLAQPLSMPLSFHCWPHSPQALDGPHQESTLSDRAVDWQGGTNPVPALSP